MIDIYLESGVNEFFLAFLTFNQDALNVDFLRL